MTWPHKNDKKRDYSFKKNKWAYGCALLFSLLFLVSAQLRWYVLLPFKLTQELISLIRWIVLLLLLNPLTAFICFFLSFLSLLYWGRRKLNDWIAFDRSLMRVMTTFVFLLSILATRTVSTLLDTWHYQKALPKAIEVEGWADAETKSGWLEGSGVVIFRLSPNTIKRVQSEGLAFMQEARQARGFSEHTYAEWKESPCVDKIFGAFADPISQSHFVSLPEGQYKSIEQALKQTGSFCTVGSYSELLVIPS